MKTIWKCQFWFPQSIGSLSCQSHLTVLQNLAMIHTWTAQIQLQINIANALLSLLWNVNRSHSTDGSIVNASRVDSLDGGGRGRAEWRRQSLVQRSVPKLWIDFRLWISAHRVGQAKHGLTIGPDGCRATQQQPCASAVYSLKRNSCFSSFWCNWSVVVICASWLSSLFLPPLFRSNNERRQNSKKEVAKDVPDEMEKTGGGKREARKSLFHRKWKNFCSNRWTCKARHTRINRRPFTFERKYTFWKIILW